MTDRVTNRQAFAAAAVVGEYLEVHTPTKQGRDFNAVVNALITAPAPPVVRAANAVLNDASEILKAIEKENNYGVRRGEQERQSEHTHKEAVAALRAMKAFTRQVAREGRA